MVSPRLRIRPATPELLAEVALQARPADVAELWAADHITPAQMLAVLARPFEARPEFADYAEPPPPDEGVYKTFCGT